MKTLLRIFSLAGALLVAPSAFAACTGQPAANLVCASPSGGAGVFNARSLVLGDFPAIADQTILGNNTGGSAVPLALSAAQVRTVAGLIIGTNVEAWDADLDTLAAPTAWRIFYSNGSSAITQLALGSSGTVLQSNGATSAPTWITPAGGGDALVANPLSQFAATTSLQFKGVISDETGSGAVAFATSPTFVTPVLGAATATSLLPTSDDGGALGSAAARWSDLFLAEGGVITWDNGDMTATQAGDVLTITGGVVKMDTGSQVNASNILTAATGQPLDADLTALALNAYAANATAASYIDFLEDTDNGSNRVRLSGAQSTADVTVTLPAATTTLVGTDTTDTLSNKTLVAPALGTPTSGVATNLTGLPLTTGVTGTLPVANGGTGATTLTIHGVLLGETTGAVVATAAMTDGQLLVGQTSADPLPKTISGDCTMAASGAITCKPTESFCIAISDETTAITTGTAKATWRMPYAFTLTDIRASLNTVSSSGSPIIDVNEGGTSIMTTNKLLIDVSELTSVTAVTAATITDSSLADDALMTADIDTAGTGAKGAKVCLIGHRT